MTININDNSIYRDKQKVLIDGINEKYVNKAIRNISEVLNTTDKTSIINAINEIKTSIPSITSNNVQNGWIKFGSLIMQWGYDSPKSPPGPYITNFNIPFTSAVYVVYASSDSNDFRRDDDSIGARKNGNSLQNFVLLHDTADPTLGRFWFAIGV